MKKVLWLLTTVFISLLVLFLLIRQVVIDNVRVASHGIMSVEEDNINTKIASWHNDLTALSRQTAVNGLLRKVGKESIVLERRILEDTFREFIRVRKDVITTVRLVDKLGNEKVVVESNGPTKNFINVRREAFYKRARDQRPFVPIATLVKKQGQSPTLEYSLNIASKGFFAGVISIGVDLDLLVSNFKRTGNDISFNEVFVFDEKGQIVSQKKLLLTNEGTDLKTVKKILNELKSNALNKKVLEYDGSFWAYFQPEKLGVTLLLEMRQESLLKQVLKIFIPIAALFVFALLAVLAVKRDKKGIKRKGNIIVADKRRQFLGRKSGSIESDAIRLKDLSNISNQIRTPLNNLLGSLSLMNATELSRKQKDYLDQATKYSEWMMELLNEITDFAALKRGNLRLEKDLFNVRQAFKEITQLVSTESYKKGIEIVNVVSYNVPENLVGDSTRLRQILVNLIGSAIKSCEQGDISLHVSSLKAKKGQCLLRIEVSESGVGVETEFAYTVFEEYEKSQKLTQRDENYNPLGLNISKQLVGMMGGELGFKNNALGGNTIWLEIPFELSEKTSQTNNNQLFSGHRAFILGENSGNRRTLANTLHSWGVNCDTTGEYSQAVSVLEKHIEDELSHEILIIDLSSSSPAEKAFDYARQIRERITLEHLKIIIISSHELGQYRQLAEELEINAYLTKPINRNQLKQAIGDVIKSAAPNLPNTETELITKSDLESTQSAISSVLVLESDKTHQKIIAGMIARYGLAADIVETQADLLKALERRPYNMVMLDYNIPDINVHTVVAKIRKLENKLLLDQKQHQERSIRCAVVMLVTSIDEQKKDKMRNNGIDEFMEKPINNESLEKVLQAWDMLESKTSEFMNSRNQSQV